MAINATINKVSLNIADTDRHYYHTHELTVAQHPSETDIRFMIKIAAFARHASEALCFSKGLCVDDEPELWQKDLNDTIELWIDFGQLDEKRIRKACAKAQQVIVYTYHKPKAEAWWQQIHTKLGRYTNLQVAHINAPEIDRFISRNMDLQCTLQDNEMLLSDAEQSITIEFLPYSLG